jgi:hypothetical protein
VSRGFAKYVGGVVVVGLLVSGTRGGRRCRCEVLRWYSGGLGVVMEIERGCVAASLLCVVGSWLCLLEYKLSLWWEGEPSEMSQLACGCGTTFQSRWSGKGTMR